MRPEKRTDSVKQEPSDGRRVSYEAPELIEYGRLSVQFARSTAIDAD